MDKPLVSVCIPTFNGEKYLQEALDSVRKQTYPNLEVVFSDDSSTDNTLQIISDFKNSYKKPVFIFKHTPQGIGANWNNCVKHANGEFIKFLFQDDLMESTCIEDLLKVFSEKTPLGMVFCKRKILFDQNNKEHINWTDEYKNIHLTWGDLKRIQKGKDLLKSKNLLQKPINKIGEPTATLLKKTVFKKVGYFNTGLNQFLDVEFWFRIMSKFDIGFVEKELVSFRLHKDQATVLNQNSIKDEKAKLISLVYQKHFHLLHPDLRKQGFAQYHPLGKIMARIKRFLKSFHFLY